MFDRVGVVASTERLVSDLAALAPSLGGCDMPDVLVRALQAERVHRAKLLCHVRSLASALIATDSHRGCSKVKRRQAGHVAQFQALVPTCQCLTANEQALGLWVMTLVTLPATAVIADDVGDGFR